MSCECLYAGDSATFWVVACGFEFWVEGGYMFVVVVGYMSEFAPLLGFVDNCGFLGFRGAII